MASGPPKDPQGVPCLFCNANKEYLHPNHFKGEEHRRGPEAPMTYEGYKEWVAEEYDLPLTHQMFQDDSLLSPNKFWDYRDLFNR